MPFQNSKIPHLRWWLLATAWFGLWHIIITYACWRDPLHRVPGPIGDNTVMLWNIGWVKHALRQGNPGFWFQNAYYPDGFFFLYGTPTWLDGYLFWLVSPLLPGDFTGAILWTNINLLLATVMSGLALISALRAFGVQSWPVLVLVSSGAVFSWFRIFALSGHYHFFGTQWMLFSLCCISWARLSLINQEHKLAFTRCAAAGLVMGIAYLNDQAMTVFAATLGSLVLFFQLLNLPLRNFSRALRFLTRCWLIFVACSVLTAAPHLIPTMRALAEGHVKYEIDKAPRLVDATSLLIPPTWHPLGHLVQPFRETHGLTWSEGTYIGIIPLVLLLLATGASACYLLRRRQNSALANTSLLQVMTVSCFTAWAFILCAVGDKLMIGSNQIMTFPGRMLKELPVINNIRLPQRWIWPAQLCIVLSGAMFLTHYLTRRGFPQRIVSASLLITAAIPPLEAVRYPAEPPLNFATDPYLNPKPLVEQIRITYTKGSILVMPAQKGYGHANILQFILGYDYPMAMTYTARMPFKPADLPWRDGRWTPQAGEWLQSKDVRILAFPYDDGSAVEYADWIREARRVIPDLQAYDRDGRAL